MKLVSSLWDLVADLWVLLGSYSFRQAQGRPYGLKYGLLAMRMNDFSEAGEELMRQSVSLLMSNHTTALISGKLVRSVGMISSIHFALSPPASVDAISPIRIGFFFAASNG